MPPWSFLFITPLVLLPPSVWFGLNVALFAVMVLQQGRLSGLPLLLHPVFFVLIAPMNPEWLLIGPGLWLLHLQVCGLPRSLAWLLLACKPQTAIFLLLWDGWHALRQRDWLAFIGAGTVAALFLPLLPAFLSRVNTPLEYSTSVLSHLGVIAAVAFTVLLLALRLDGLDTATLLSPIWAPYIRDYNLVAPLFVLRGGGWLVNTVVVVLSVALAAVFWTYGEAQRQLGSIGMFALMLAALAVNRNQKRRGALNAPPI